MLNLQDDIEVVAEVTDGETTVPAAISHRPDVAVVDIDLPGTDGLTASAELAGRRCPGGQPAIAGPAARPNAVRCALPAIHDPSPIRRSRRSAKVR